MADPDRPKTIRWVGDLAGHVELIDQTALPVEFRVLACRTVESVWQAIREMKIRGAPAIGIAAAMGVVLGVRDVADEASVRTALRKTCEYLASARPTAVNPAWAMRRMEACASRLMGQGLEVIKVGLLEEAKAILVEDAATCRAIGESGKHLIADGEGVMTHCNAGALATAEYGTALACVYAAHAEGKKFTVYATETRPLLQGARLTAWELVQAGIDVTVICDSAAAQVMKEHKVSVVITGADRVAANGDTANKIGTYGMALLSQAHDVPFYVAAPGSTIDLQTPSGEAIKIEQRPPEEVSRGFGLRTIPDGAACYNPAFDVTPARLIHGLITEKGVIHPVCEERVREFFGIPACIRPKRD